MCARTAAVCRSSGSHATAGRGRDASPLQDPSDRGHEIDGLHGARDRRRAARSFPIAGPAWFRNRDHPDKKGEPVWIPIRGRLAETLDTWDKMALTAPPTEQGRPYDEGWFQHDVKPYDPRRWPVWPTPVAHRDQRPHDFKCNRGLLAGANKGNSHGRLPSDSNQAAAKRRPTSDKLARPIF